MLYEISSVYTQKRRTFSNHSDLSLKRRAFDFDCEQRTKYCQAQAQIEFQISNFGKGPPNLLNLEQRKGQVKVRSFSVEGQVKG